MFIILNKCLFIILNFSFVYIAKHYCNKGEPSLGSGPRFHDKISNRKISNRKISNTQNINGQNIESKISKEQDIKYGKISKRQNIEKTKYRMTIYRSDKILNAKYGSGKISNAKYRSGKISKVKYRILKKEEPLH